MDRLRAEHISQVSQRKKTNSWRPVFDHTRLSKKCKFGSNVLRNWLEQNRCSEKQQKILGAQGFKIYPEVSAKMLYFHRRTVVADCSRHIFENYHFILPSTEYLMVKILKTESKFAKIVLWARLHEKLTKREFPMVMYGWKIISNSLFPYWKTMSNIILWKRRHRVIKTEKKLDSLSVHNF